MKFVAFALCLCVAPLCAQQPEKPTPFQPLFYDGFEAAPAGSPLKAPYDAAGRSRISREQAHSGKQAARMEIRRGDGGGFGRWGAVLPIKPALTKGQEIWVRLYVYWPQNFQFSAAPWMKFLRLHTKGADGKNRGYNDLYIDRADTKSSVLRTIKEGHDKWAVYDGEPIAREKWERYEMYLSLDNVPADAGGKGRVRIWRDGKLIFNRGDVPTLSEASDALDYFYLFTYWNNENPPDNHCFVDDLCIATSNNPPRQRDASGNAMIGDWTP
jgi:hypothetical protein